MSKSFSEKIKERAVVLGFSHCGIAKAVPLEKEKRLFTEIIQQQSHANLSYLERNIDTRFAPELLLENCKSVIVVLFNYLTNSKLNSDYRLAGFSLINDYHVIIKEKLKDLSLLIAERFPGTNQKITVDSSAISEKNWAVKAGLGIIGKNSLLQNEQGSFFLIGTILTDLELEYDTEKSGNCGNCTTCMDACPTKAILTPYRIDIKKCIAYQTIESKEAFDKTASGEKWIFGCDTCQEVCPKNQKSTANQSITQYYPPFLHFTNADFENLDEEKFSYYFKDSAIKRRKFAGFKANIERITKNEK